MILRVTHYFRRPPSKNGWIEAPFISRLAGASDGPYYYGFETDDPLDATFLQELEARQEVKRIDYPYRIDQSRRLWISPDGDVFLASMDNPLGDPEKIPVDRVRAQHIPSVVWDRAATKNILLQSPTVQQSFQSHKLGWERGYYLNSKRDGSEPYWPSWQVAMRTDIHDHLRAVGSEVFGSMSLDLKKVGAQEHQYRAIERRIFKQRLALPFEMIFETTERQKTINVVSLGNAEYLSLVYFPGSAVQSALELQPDDVYNGYGNDWIDRIEAAEVRVCAPTDQAVDDLLTDAISGQRLTYRLKSEEQGIGKLLAWIADARMKGVIACDVGIAYQLIQAGKDRGLQMTLVRYDDPLPVGLAYSNDDQEWGAFLKLKLRTQLQSPDSEVQESLAETKLRFSDLGMVFAPPADYPVAA
jgi:hypothetical protein